MLPLSFKFAVPTLMWEKNLGKFKLDTSVNRGLDGLRYRGPRHKTNDPIGLSSVGQYVHNGQ